MRTNRIPPAANSTIRLGLDIDLTAPAASGREPAHDSNSIDFELSEPDTESGAGKPDLPHLPELPAKPQ
jgi:hypothetical protein